MAELVIPGELIDVEHASLLKVPPRHIVEDAACNGLGELDWSGLGHEIAWKDWLRQIRAPIAAQVLIRDFNLITG